MKCIGNFFSRHNPEYRGIHGWDLGGAQFRWPGTRIRRRSVVLGEKTIDRVTLKNIFDYDVSIQLLVEDLAYYKRACRSHVHWIRNKWGKRIRQLNSDEAYYVHHHSGEISWSQSYWKRISRHLEIINSVKSSSLMASFDRHMM